MIPRTRTARAFAIVAAILLLCTLGDSRVYDPFAGFPRTMLWAWERPERLDSVNPRAAGVALLAATVRLQGDNASVIPRLQPLRVNPAARIVAVVRLETRAAALNNAQREAAVAAILKAAQLPRVAAVQIDFDATASERAFYRRLIADLRRRLPAAMPISITALASWCIYDDWISDLPIDEAVPMLFRMGADERNIRSYLANGNHFRAAVCRNSVGLSTDEPITTVPPVARTYWFHPRAWDPASLQNVAGE